MIPIPRPILCDTDSEIQNATDTNTNVDNFFRQDETIPDFTDSNVNAKLNSVRGDNTDDQTIDQMISKCQPENEIYDNDEDNTSITKKFSSLIGEMRVDILSLVNLIGVLNNNVTSNNNDIQYMKKEMNKLITDNVSLREKIVRLKDDQISIRDAYDARFETLKQSIPTNQTQDIKIIKKNDTNNETKDNEKNNEKNEFNDALMEKRANKFKVVPTRTRVGNDMFGTAIETKEELLLNNSTRRIMRKENVDNMQKKTKDSSQIRSARLGLNHESDQDLTLTPSTAKKPNLSRNVKKNK